MPGLGMTRTVLSFTGRENLKKFEVKCVSEVAIVVEIKRFNANHISQ